MYNTLEPKINQGFLFKNNFKKLPTHPDMRGDLHIDRELLTQLLAESQDQLIKIELGSYTKTTKDNNNKYIALYASKPYVKPSSPNELPDDDIPF